MDDQDLQSSPRKKLKMDVPSSNFSEEHQVAGEPSSLYQENATSVVTLPKSSHDLQVHKEEDVGITEFISPDLPGFTGVLKKRYTDFLVNEILLSGQVVHLDDLKVPKQGEKKEFSTQTEQRPADVANQVVQSTYIAPGSDELHPQVQPGSARLTTTHPASRSSTISQETIIVEPKPRPVDSEGAGNKELQLDSAPSNANSEGITASTEHAVMLSSSSTTQWQSFSNKIKGFQLAPADDATLKGFFEADVVQQLLDLFNRVLNSPHRKAKDYGVVKSAPIADRTLRTKMHQELRRIFSSRLESFTDGEGVVSISAAPEVSNWGTKGGGQNGRGGNDASRRPQTKGKLGWKELGGEYLHFTLYKENKDTMEVVSFLARQLKTSPKSFNFAGTKDRRGVTVQRISVYRTYADRLVSVGRTLRGSKVGNYEYHPRGLELGELKGNEFIITLRDCQFPAIQAQNFEDRLAAASAVLAPAAKYLSEKGYLNYYGLQRFGTFSTRTDTIGMKMLQGDFKGAVEAILTFNPKCLDAAAKDPVSDKDAISSDDKARAYAINLFQTTGTSFPALETLPRKFSAETSIIRHLATADRAQDHLGALQTISKNLRLMYVHAYQSLVWNLAASRRWKHCGEKLLVGDLVLVDDHRDKVVPMEEPEQVDVDGEVIVLPDAHDSATAREDRFVRARTLREEDIASGKYSIYDVVLPTPGFDVLYPDNFMLSFYESFMASKEGGQLDPHNMRRPWKDISLSGSYRKLLATPVDDISFTVHGYVNEDEQFVNTDLDRLSKKDGSGNGTTSTERASHGSHTYSHNEGNIGGDERAQSGVETIPPKAGPGPGEPKIAVVLQMQLGSSQYATMALRELMKVGGVRTYKPDFGGGR